MTTTRRAGEVAGQAVHPEWLSCHAEETSGHILDRLASDMHPSRRDADIAEVPRPSSRNRVQVHPSTHQVERSSFKNSAPIVHYREQRAAVMEKFLIG